MKWQHKIPCESLKSDPPAPLYFLSDTHLSSSTGELANKRMQNVLALLDEIRVSKGTLFIVGDFFDFWFDCRNYVPPALRAVVQKLKDLDDNNITVHYIGGNHDHWIPGYLTHEIGLHYYPEALTFRCEGKSFYCVHGDQVVYNNALYPLFRKIMHAPLPIAILKVLPVKWIYKLGEYVSHYNRVLSKIPNVPQQIVKQMQEFLAYKLREGYDMAICGHVHQPVCIKKGAGKKAVILGDWIRHQSYGFWKDGSFRLIEKD